MSIKAVILFLLIICAIALVSGPGFRRVLMAILGISRRDR